MKAVFRVELNAVHHDGRRKFTVFETDCASVAEFHQRLQEDKVIYGQSLFTPRGEEKGEYEIVDRNEMILGREAIWSVTVPRDRYFEYSEVA